MDTQSYIFRQKKIQELLEKVVFKVVTPNNVIMLEEVLGNNPFFIDNIKNLYINKANKKICLVVHTYNDDNKNLVLMHPWKILKFSQGIDSCFTAIIWDNKNDNIKF